MTLKGGNIFHRATCCQGRQRAKKSWSVKYILVRACLSYCHSHSTSTITHPAGSTLSCRLPAPAASAPDGAEQWPSDPMVSGPRGAGGGRRPADAVAAPPPCTFVSTHSHYTTVRLLLRQVAPMVQSRGGTCLRERHFIAEGRHSASLGEGRQPTEGAAL